MPSRREQQQWVNALAGLLHGIGGGVRNYQLGQLRQESTARRGRSEQREEERLKMARERHAALMTKQPDVYEGVPEGSRGALDRMARALASETNLTPDRKQELLEQWTQAKMRVESGSALHEAIKGEEWFKGVPEEGGFFTVPSSRVEPLFGLGESAQFVLEEPDAVGGTELPPFLGKMPIEKAEHYLNRLTQEPQWAQRVRQAQGFGGGGRAEPQGAMQGTPQHAQMQAQAAERTQMEGQANRAQMTSVPPKVKAADQKVSDNLTAMMKQYKTGSPEQQADAYMKLKAFRPDLPPPWDVAIAEGQDPRMILMEEEAKQMMAGGAQGPIMDLPSGYDPHRVPEMAPTPPAGLQAGQQGPPRPPMPPQGVPGVRSMQMPPPRAMDVTKQTPAQLAAMIDDAEMRIARAVSQGDFAMAVEIDRVQRMLRDTYRQKTGRRYKARR